MSGNQIALAFRIAADITALKANLAEGISQVETTAASMKRMANSLDGSKLIADANAMVKAVQDLGGAANLTEGEQKRVNDAVSAAIDKYEALGRQAPPALLAMQQATEKIEGPMQRVNDTLQEVGTHIGAMITSLVGATAIVGAGEKLFEFAKSAIESAGALEDMSAKTGLSTDNLQRMQFVAGQTGSTLDDFTNAAFKLGVNIQDGGKKVQEAVERMGLSLDALQQMNPDEQWEAIVKGLESITNAQQRNLTGTELFGKGARSVMAAISKGYTDLGSSAQLSGEAQIHALKEAEDALNKFEQNAKNKLVGIAGTFVEAGNQIASQSIWQTIKVIMGSGFTSVSTFAAMNGATPHDINLPAPPPPKPPPPPDPAWVAHMKAVQELVDKLNGVDIAQRVTDLTDALTLMGGASKLTADQLKAVTDEAVGLRDIGADLPPVLQGMVDKFDALKESAQAFADIGAQLQNIPIAQGFADNTWLTRVTLASHDVGDLGLSLINVGQVATEAGKRVHDFVPPPTWLDGVEQDLTHFAGSILVGFGPGGSISHALNGGAQLLGADAGQKLLDPITNTLWSEGKGKLAGVFDSLAGPLGSAVVGLGLDLGKKLWNSLFGTAGRDAVTTFASSMGGFDALHTKLDGLGASGETLWKTLTQGVGRNNPAQAQAAIDAITKALGDADQKAQQLTSDVQKYGLGFADFKDPSKLAAGFQSQASGLLGTFSELTGAGYDPSTVVKHMSGDLNDLVATALQTGQKIPPGLQPILETLTRMNLLTDDNKQALLGLSGVKLNGGSFDDVMAAAGRYGLTLDQLGPKVNQLNIDKTAQQLSSDWKLLTSDGEDTGAVMDKMKGQVQDLLTHALKFGDTIPDTMKPMIDAMIHAGDLTDQFGNKLTDDSKLNWSHDLATDMDTLIGKIGDLIDKIAGPNGAGAAFDGLGNKVVTPTIRPRYDGSGIPSSYAPTDTPDYGGAMAAGGDFYVTKPTWFLAGEAGPERATFSGANKAGSGQGGDVHVHVDLTGATVRSDSDIDTLVMGFADVMRRNGAARTRVNQSLGGR